MYEESNRCYIVFVIDRVSNLLINYHHYLKLLPSTLTSQFLSSSPKRNSSNYTVSRDEGRYYSLCYVSETLLLNTVGLPWTII